jgi:cytochrome c oxidase cbb3-type subunit 3
MSNFWSVFIIVLVVGNIIGIVWLLLATAKGVDSNDPETTGHEWDGIKELNNPLPRWWLWLFVLTIIYGVGYLYFYPGLGAYEGSLGWSQKGQYEQAKQENSARKADFYSEFETLDIPSLAINAKAMDSAERLFGNNCAICHGSDGGGAKGFPNLTDADWLYHNDPASIVATLTNGRAGVMPDLNLSPADVTVMAYYVKYLSGEQVSEHVQREGKKRFATCAACHGPDGKGNKTLGAPNLTDQIWLYGSRIADIEAILRNGKRGNMPSFKATLSETEIRLLSAYVLAISSGAAEQDEQDEQDEQGSEGDE